MFEAPYIVFGGNDMKNDYNFCFNDFVVVLVATMLIIIGISIWLAQ